MNQTSATEKLLVGADEAATMLGIGRSLLYSMSADGRLGVSPVTFGKRKLYSVDELRDWIRAGCPIRERWLQIRGAG